ncbi:MAG: hypothetical protein GF308_02980 [Candidatus Heimdallarchaeota archaeon]|nr:hypothetical protein [Candidatus Heimdallarchaeota archaeon]
MLSIMLTPILNYNNSNIKQSLGDPPPFFSITIIIPDNIPERVLWGDIIRTELESIGIGVTIDYKTFYEATDMIFTSPVSTPVPVYDSGGFDALIIGWLFTDPDWYPTEQFGSSRWPTNGYNYYQYSSPLCEDALVLHNNTCLTSNRIPYSHQIQDILREDLPSVPIVYLRDVYPIANTITPEDLHLWRNARQPLDLWTDSGDSNLFYATVHSFDICHPYLTEVYYDRQWLNQIYDSLIYRSGDSMDWVPRIADSYYNSGCLNWTVEIDPLAKWADGTAVTADDVVFSYEAMMDPTLNSVYSWISTYLDNIVALDPTTVLFTFKEHYTFTETLLALPLIPKDIWLPTSEGGTGPEYVDWETQAETWATADPSKIFGCGPFKLQLANATSQIIILEKNAYFGDLIHFNEPDLDTIHFIYYSDKTTALADLAAGQVEVVDAYFRCLPTEVGIAGTTDHIVNRTIYHEFGMNLLHPYLGTGSSCPIPGPESAKHIRKAICNIMPRQQIIDDTLAWAAKANSHCPEGCVGYKDAVPFCEYSIDAAKNHMRTAGFLYPEDLTNTTTTTPTTVPSNTSGPPPSTTSTPPSSTSTFSFPVFGLMGIIALIGGCLIIVVTRKKR